MLRTFPLPSSCCVPGALFTSPVAVVPSIGIGRSYNAAEEVDVNCPTLLICLQCRPHTAFNTLRKQCKEAVGVGGILVSAVGGTTWCWGVECMVPPLGAPLSSLDELSMTVL